MGASYSQTTTSDKNDEYEYDYDYSENDESDESHESNNTMQRVSIKVDQMELLKALLKFEREKREQLEVANVKMYNTMNEERETLRMYAERIHSLEARIGALGITLDDAIELSINENNRTYVANDDINDTV